jgi:hypothetical protein
VSARCVNNFKRAELGFPTLNTFARAMISYVVKRPNGRPLDRGNVGVGVSATVVSGRVIFGETSIHERWDYPWFLSPIIDNPIGLL